MKPLIIIDSPFNIETCSKIKNPINIFTSNKIVQKWIIKENGTQLKFKFIVYQVTVAYLTCNQKV